MKKLTSCVLAAFVALSTSAHAGLFDDDEARKQIKQLADKVEAQGKENDARFLKLDESIRNLGIIQLLNQIEQLNAEIARLRGQVEVLANQNEQLQKRQKDFYLDIDTRLRALEGTGSPPATPAVPPTGAGPVGAAPTESAATPPAGRSGAPLTEREDRAYDVGTVAFRRGDFRAAVRAFETFVTDFPSSALAPNAMYWVGVSQFNLKDYTAARSAEETLIKRYPESAKVPDAMLMIASVQIETGDSGSARNTLEDIIAKYPMSDAAVKARTRLAAARR